MPDYLHAHALDLLLQLPYHLGLLDLVLCHETARRVLLALYVRPGQYPAPRAPSDAWLRIKCRCMRAERNRYTGSSWHARHEGTRCGPLKWPGAAA